MAKKTVNSSAAQSLGRKGGLKGGTARARKLTSSQKSEIARKGGQAKAASNKKPKK
jgi:general stress protein YciG